MTPRPDHLFLSSDGALHDTRAAGWSQKPLRTDFSFTHARIRSTAELRATLRAGQYAWPGGYQLYFVTSDGAALSFEAVRAELQQVLRSISTHANDGWRVVACEVNWEDDDLLCDHTGKPIPAAYSDKEA
jgi:hypothetical protein